MKCYPIIYTRTNCCDYYANFHVIPEFVNANEVRPYILSATVTLDPTAKKIKKMVVANDQYCIFGYIGFIKDIFANVNSNIQPYSRDNKGRAVYGFFGFAFQDTNSSMIPLLNVEDCFTAFEQYIMPVWKNTVPESVVPSPVTLEETPHVSTAVQPVAVHGNCHFYREEGNLFDAVLTDWANTKSDVSYCSWLGDYSQIRNCLFAHVVTTDNNIFRLNKETSSTGSASSAETDECSPNAERYIPLSAAEELQMMMRNEENMHCSTSVPTEETETTADMQGIEEQSQAPDKYQHLYQSSETSARERVQASKKKDTAAKNTRIPQEPIFDQIIIDSSEYTEIVKKGVIVAGAVAAAVGVGAAVNIAVKKRRKKCKKNKRKEGMKNGK